MPYFESESEGGNRISRIFLEEEDTIISKLESWGKKT